MKLFLVMSEVLSVTLVRYVESSIARGRLQLDRTKATTWIELSRTNIELA